MKKLIVCLSVLAVVLVSVAGVAYAQNPEAFGLVRAKQVHINCTTNTSAEFAMDDQSFTGTVSQLNTAVANSGGSTISAAKLTAGTSISAVDLSAGTNVTAANIAGLTSYSITNVTYTNYSYVISGIGSATTTVTFNIQFSTNVFTFKAKAP